MRADELQYNLPPELIAQTPAERRDLSRLLVLDRATGQRRHERFDRLPQLLPPGSLLVLNDTRVFPARLELRRQTGGRVDGLFLREEASGVWEVMLSGSDRLKPGEPLLFVRSERTLRLTSRIEAGVWRAEPDPPGQAVTILNECGQPPLPPYIKRPSGSSAAASIETDTERYQTVYASRPGAIAAPTAGLHFTREVFAALASAGIPHVFVTLHVGIGTFAPIRCDDLRDHDMHAEWYDCPTESAAAINTARAAGRPIVAVGTTSVRVLETCASPEGPIVAGSGWTRLFIYPPYRFRALDTLLTNFHLPGSTLLALVSAFAGREAVLAAYQDAIGRQYRFYSYGDAMLVL